MYYVFCGRSCCPTGGINDLVGVEADLETALKAHQPEDAEGTDGRGHIVTFEGTGFCIHAVWARQWRNEVTYCA